MTMAANFQSDIVMSSSSFSRNRFVMYLQDSHYLPDCQLSCVPDLPQDELHLLRQADGDGEGPPGTAAVVGVAAVAGHLLLTAGVETNLPARQCSAHVMTSYIVEAGIDTLINI